MTENINIVIKMINLNKRRDSEKGTAWQITVLLYKQ